MSDIGQHLMFAVAKPVAKRVLPGNACVSNASESDQTTLRARTRADGSCPELPAVLQKAEITRMIAPVRESFGESRIYGQKG